MDFTSLQNQNVSSAPLETLKVQVQEEYNRQRLSAAIGGMQGPNNTLDRSGGWWWHHERSSGSNSPPNRPPIINELIARSRPLSEEGDPQIPRLCPQSLSNSIWAIVKLDDLTEPWQIRHPHSPLPLPLPPPLLHSLTTSLIGSSSAQPLSYNVIIIHIAAIRKQRLRVARG